MSDEDDPFDHWVALMNKGHGYAGVFNYSPGTTDKRIVERATIERWRAAIAESFDLKTALIGYSFENFSIHLQPPKKNRF